MADPNTILFPKSSNLKSATLDPAASTLDVTFSNGTTYRYANFTAALLKEWGEAKSAGKWFHDTVKQAPDKYPLLPTGAAAAATPPPGVPALPEPAGSDPVQADAPAPEAPTPAPESDASAPAAVATTTAKTAPLPKMSAPPARVTQTKAGKFHQPWRRGPNGSTDKA